MWIRICIIIYNQLDCIIESMHCMYVCMYMYVRVHVGINIMCVHVYMCIYTLMYIHVSQNYPYTYTCTYITPKHAWMHPRVFQALHLHPNAEDDSWECPETSFGTCSLLSMTNCLWWYYRDLQAPHLVDCWLDHRNQDASSALVTAWDSLVCPPWLSTEKHVLEQVSFSCERMSSTRWGQYYPWSKASYCYCQYYQTFIQQTYL